MNERKLLFSPPQGGRRGRRKIWGGDKDGKEKNGWGKYRFNIFKAGNLRLFSQCRLNGGIKPGDYFFLGGGI